MKKMISYKKLKFTYIKYTIAALFGCLLCVRGFVPFEKTGDNLFHVSVNGTEVGSVGTKERAEELLLEARKNIALESEDITFIEMDMTMEGEEVLWGRVDEEEAVLEQMESVLRGSIRESMQRSYTVKINEYMVNLLGIDEVRGLLQAAIDKYDSEGDFTVELIQDGARELNVLKAAVVEVAEEESEQTELAVNCSAGIQTFFSDLGQQEPDADEMEFDDYKLGLMRMDFAEKVEIVESYLPESQLIPLQAAIDQVIKEQETPSEYAVVSGDTLSEISLKVNIPMDRIIEMNDALDNENTPIRVGQKLIVTVPEPELSVTREEQIYVEEIYDAEVIYKDNDSWYTYETQVLQQPSAGFRKIIADVSYLNDKEVGREILKEEVVMEAVPMIVERGTKIPPTYIKPISGGRLSSGFGRRKAPKRGASSYHKGVDWATPTGTAVYASCGGVVEKAGWGSGYGYVIYINHEDGRQTRYGHLSKVLVKAGQSVKQGDKIALSGSTGVSTGPHLHFEILIGGKQVNPLNYLE
ncbi:MAG: M23 family metallopeptidase [Lachnospiraceae bacterium]|nr:M23 family metallopeptidase [Lachnospiraceae bacterium]